MFMDNRNGNSSKKFKKEWNDINKTFVGSNGKKMVRQKGKGILSSEEDDISRKRTVERFFPEKDEMKMDLARETILLQEFEKNLFPPKL